MEETTTSVLIVETVVVIIGIVFIVIGKKIKDFLNTSEYIKKYNLDNEVTERILENALMYAEHYLKDEAKDYVSKQKTALEYIEKIDPNMVKKYGESLKLMLERKEQKLLHS